MAALRIVAFLLLAATASQVPAGTAKLSGRIVVDETQARAVRGAIVTLTGELPRSKAIITDENGVFEFTGLPAGRFTLTASKPPFVTMAYGAKRADRPGTPITIAAGASVTDIVLRLPRGAVISGVIRDQDGNPIPEVTVTAVRPDAAPRSGPIVSPYSAATDDRGIYRIFGLPQGRYLLAASVRVTGLSGDVSSPSTSDVDRALAQLRQSAVQSTTAGTIPQSRVPMPVVGYAPVFYPGTALPAAAESIVVAPGQEQAADFAVVPVSTGTIEGVLQTFDGSPLPAVGTDLGLVGSLMPPTLGQIPTLAVRPGADGRFKFTGVVPGKYLLLFRTQAARADPSVPSTVSAATEITFTGTDITGLQMVLRPGQRFAGRLVFDGTTLAPADLSAVRLTLAAVQSGYFLSIGVPISSWLTASGTGKADATFDVSGVTSGTYGVTAVVPSPWRLLSVVVNGKDVTDGSIDMASDDVTDAVLTLTDRHSELSGKLQTAASTPATDYFVVAFPADQSLWAARSRRIKTARPATDGSFSIADLPGGTYLLAALTDVEPADLNDSAFLAQLVAASVKVTLAEGEKKIQDF